MKKRIFALCLIVSLLLAGCSLPEPPDTAADGTPWSDDWTTLGAVLGVENVDGWRLLRNEDVLAAEGMYFASWVMGESALNAEGESVYPAQVFLVLSECETAADTERLITEWLALVSENYTAEAPQTLDHKLGSFTLIPYRCDDNSTFARGISCVGVVGNRAVNLEVSCMEDVELDPEGTIIEYLNGFHFAD